MAKQETRQRRQHSGNTEQKKVLVAGKISVSMQRVLVREIIEEEEVENELDVETFVTEPAMLEIAAGLTRNLGEFESLKVYVAVRIPCYKEQIPTKADEVGAMVSDILNNEVDVYLDSEEAGSNDDAD